MKSLLLTCFLGLSCVSFGQDQWTGSFMYDHQNAKGDHEIITISKKDGCYSMTWGTASNRYPMKIEAVPVKCETETGAPFKFIITLWEFEKYELDPIEYDADKRVMAFDISGFDEPMVFKRIF